MLTIANLSFAYEEDVVLRQLNLSLLAGELVHLRGANGSGKTTLMKLIAGLYPISFGNLLLNKPLHFKQEKVFFSIEMGFHPELTVRQNIRFFRIELPIPLIALELEQLRLSHKQDVVFSHLSLGQQQKIVLATLKHCDAALWLLDEPFANLDQTGKDWLLSGIDVHLQKKGSVILTAHEQPHCAGMKIWQLA